MTDQQKEQQNKLEGFKFNFDAIDWKMFQFPYLFVYQRISIKINNKHQILFWFI